MQTNKFEEILLNTFKFTPTADQRKVLFGLSRFIISTKPRCTFLLKGFAGTGKTSVVGALVQALKVFGKETVLLAPTGRAAKVMSRFAGKSAFTIHKKIYSKRATDEGLNYFERMPNKHKKTLFIVDEASMIGAGDGLVKGTNIIQDLIDFVFSSSTCSLLLIGDDAQLPPIGEVLSRAMNVDDLRFDYDLTIGSLRMKDVVRQAQDSGILYNCTKIRKHLENPDQGFVQFECESYTDIVPVQGDVQEYLEDAYSRYGSDQVMVICPSNKRANVYNQHIRSRIFDFDTELAQGDLIMVVRNNYFWSLGGKNKLTDFIANGEILEIERVVRVYEAYGYQFADVDFCFPDDVLRKSYSVKMFLNTLTQDAPALTYNDLQALYAAIEEDYVDIKSARKRREKILKDPHYHALQVKYAYAITCHKSQGGQWPVVFVDHGYLRDDPPKNEFYRWLYTGMTRSSEQLYLLNFDKRFISENKRFIE